MSIKVTWQDDCRFNVVTDEWVEVSIDLDGKLAPCPTDILLSALGWRSATDVTLYFKDKGIELEALTNLLTYQLTENVFKTAIEDALNKFCHFRCYNHRLRLLIQQIFLFHSHTITLNYIFNYRVQWPYYLHLMKTKLKQWARFCFVIYLTRYYYPLNEVLGFK